MNFPKISDQWYWILNSLKWFYIRIITKHIQITFTAFSDCWIKSPNWRIDKHQYSFRLVVRPLKYMKWFKLHWPILSNKLTLNNILYMRIWNAKYNFRLENLVVRNVIIKSHPIGWEIQSIIHSVCLSLVSFFLIQTIKLNLYRDI